MVDDAALEAVPDAEDDDVDDPDVVLPDTMDEDEDDDDPELPLTAEI